MPVVSESARNRFVGLVTHVLRDTVMAQVEIQAGPHRIVAHRAARRRTISASSRACSPSPPSESTNVVVEVPDHA